MRPIGSKFTGLALGLLLAAPHAGAAELKRVAERLIPFAPGGEVHIQDKNGQLVVEAWPRHEVRIQITRIVRDDDAARAAALMKDLQTDVEVRKDQVDVQSRFPKRAESLGLLDLFGRRNNTIQINYYVQVPEETSLDLDTANGEVRATGTTGSLDAETTNGDIWVKRLNGDITVSTTNGEVHLDGVAGQATAHTTNGSVMAEIRRVPATGTVHLETTNGDVQAWFDRDLRANLEAMTTNGRVTTSYSISRQGVMTSRTIRGTIQGGGAKISIATTNGNVEVRRIGEGRP